MKIVPDKIDDAVLGLLWLTLHDERRAWKGFDWGVMERLHRKGLIEDPVNERVDRRSVGGVAVGAARAPGVGRVLLGALDVACRA